MHIVVSVESDKVHGTKLSEMLLVLYVVVEWWLSVLSEFQTLFSSVLGVPDSDT